jgi:hypothetical protein
MGLLAMNPCISQSCGTEDFAGKQAGAPAGTQATEAQQEWAPFKKVPMWQHPLWSSKPGHCCDNARMVPLYHMCDCIQDTAMH